MVKRVVLTALAAGAIAGLFMWAVQAAKVVPLILHAELYEQRGEADHGAVHSPEAAVPHNHEGDAWEPADGLERQAFTLLADLIVGMGFAFMLVGAIALRGEEITWRQGVAWGLAGFAAFYAGPSLGLPPELPGMVAADLPGRQIWWIGTAAATAGGLALAVFGRRVLPVAAGAALILLPHLIGAPGHASESGPLPAALAAEFAVASLVTVQLFWIVLGGLSGYFYDRFGRA